MVIYSHSRLSNYEQCPLKFKFRYMDKLEEGNSIEGFLGTQVHESLHFIYNQVKLGILPTLQQVLEYYRDLWDKHFDINLRIVKTELTPSYYFEKGLVFIQKYYDQHKPFDENVLSMEERVLIDLDGTKTYLVQGFIDKLVHNREENIYEIHDYKTSNWLKSQGELDKDRQLALYSIGIKKRFPDANGVLLKWHFLNHGVEKTSSRTDEELEELKTSIIELIKKIETETEWPAKTSILCKWCGYNGRCPEYKRKIMLNEKL